MTCDTEAIESVLAPIRNVEHGGAKQRLILTVGLPRSGKSTWARDHGAPIVSTDAILAALPRCNYEKNSARAIARVMVQALFAAGHETVIFDDCNVSPERRQEWVSDYWETLFAVLETPASVCIERARDDSDTLGVELIERLAREWDPPACPRVPMHRQE